MYRTLSHIAKRFFSEAQIYKYGFNLSPMYKRSTGKIVEVSQDLHHVKVKIPISYKNRNYVGSIFGGSLFSATDPIYMIQLLNILGDNYVVWDKEATIKYKKPAKEDVFCDFTFSTDEIETIKIEVKQHGKFNIVKETNIINKRAQVIAELTKTIYVANKSYYRERRQQKAHTN